MLVSIILLIAGFAAGYYISFVVLKRFSLSYQESYIEAITLYEKGDYKIAIGKFKEVLLLTKKKNYLTPSSYIGLAKCYSKLNDIQHASYYLDKAIHIYKDLKYPQEFIIQTEKLKGKLHLNEFSEAI